ncbi:MAG: STAS domain-containing protein [Acidobacteriota bacterium]
MIVSKSRHPQGIVLRVEGVIKLGESAEFLAQTLDRILSQEEGDVVLDLEQINYIDSTGIGELVGYLGRFGERQRKMVLVRPSERIHKLLELANLLPLFQIYESVDAALGTAD